MVFSACFLPPTPSFPPETQRPVSVLCFPACFFSKNTRHVFFPLHFLSYTHVSPLLTPISFRGVFFRLLFFPKTHDMCFFPYISSHTHTFLLCSHRLASGVCFSACFSFQKHTTCVFSLTFPLIHTLFFPRSLFSPRPINKLPEWFFQLAFLFLRPRRGFFRSPISLHAQFSPRNRSISFQSGVSSLLFSSYTHTVGFSAHFLPPTPSFLLATDQ